MTMKVKAVEKKLKFTKNENDPGVWRYVTSADDGDIEDEENGTHTDPTDLTDNNGGGENTQIT